MSQVHCSRQPPRLAVFAHAALVIAAGLAAAPAALAQSGMAAAPGRVLPAPRAAAQPKSAEATLAEVETALACACYEGSELVIDPKRSLRREDCPCAYADKIRADLQASLSGLDDQRRADRRLVAFAVEEEFLPKRPDYERLLRYDARAYTLFLEGIHCGCGCSSGAMSNCQLDCSTSALYKRRGRIWLALGLGAGDLLDQYVTEFNASHGPADQHERAWFQVERQRRRGWGIPAAVLALVVVVLFFAVRSWTRRSGGPGDGNSSPDGRPSDGGSPTQVAELSNEERLRLDDALDDIEVE